VKIGIFGAGSIGCWLGGKLIAAGHDVVMVGRLADIREHGLELTDFSGARVVVERDRVRYYVDDANALADREAVLVTTKSAATADAGATIAKVTSSTCVVASFQNGVTNATALRAALPNRVVLAGMVPFNVVNKGRGHFHNGTSGPLELERGAPDLVRALVDAGFGVVEHGDLRPVQWSKLLVNLNNALNALSGLPLREQLSHREWRLLMAQLVREGLAAIQAAGMKPVRIGKLIPSLAPFALSLPNFLFFRVASAMVKIDPEARSSMWEDLERRRLTEIEELNGAIVALGAKHGVSTTLNARVVALVHEAERNHAGSPKLRADQITTT
jgi:2-dehydropantoate 2-reductase